MPQSVIASVVGVTVSGLIGTMLSAFSFNAPVSAARWAEVTISAVAGTGMNVFSFDAPVGSHGVLNFPHTGGASVTVSGLNFGRHDVSPSVAISALSCHSAAWTSGTSLLCRSALLWGYHGMAPITIGGLVATLSSTLSFDAPVVSHAKSNTPRTGGVEITVNGLNFALQDLSTSVRISLVACGSSVWISRTMIRCAVPRTTMPNKVVAVTVSRVVSTGCLHVRLPRAFSSCSQHARHWRRDAVGPRAAFWLGRFHAVGDRVLGGLHDLGVVHVYVASLRSFR